MHKDLRAIAFNMLWVLAVGYFVYHLITGARGILSFEVLSDELPNLEQTLRQLKSENAFLENKISRIREDNLDLDLLEEEAQRTLGFFYPDDKVVLLPKE